jgi:hypothetical protein
LISPKTTGFDPPDRDQFRRHAARLHHPGDSLRVSLNVGPVGGDIGNGKQGYRLIDDSSIVLLPPSPGRLGGRDLSGTKLAGLQLHKNQPSPK